MTLSLRYIVPATAAVVLFVSCGKKEEQVEKQEIAAVVGADTIPVDDLAEIFENPSTLSGDKRERLILQLVVARQTRRQLSKEEIEQLEETALELAENLSLQTGEEWKPAAALSLLFASKTIHDKLDGAGSATTIKQYLDSVLITVASNSSTIELDSGTLAGQDTTLMGKRKRLSEVAAAAFLLSPTVADIVADFSYSEPLAEGNKALGVEDMVKGLVYDSAAAASEATSLGFKDVKHVQRDNSALALKFRTQQSIMDSISKHIPHLEAIYKKKLKVHNDMKGKVVVTFRVGSDGKVMIAKVTASEISEMAFLKPFLAYVKKIRFKEIPQKVGAMTFEFPFEFSPTL